MLVTVRRHNKIFHAFHSSTLVNIELVPRCHRTDSVARGCRFCHSSFVKSSPLVLRKSVILVFNTGKSLSVMLIYVI
jgi:hypothetical protein